MGKGSPIVVASAAHFPFLAKFASQRFRVIFLVPGSRRTFSVLWGLVSERDAIPRGGCSPYLRIGGVPSGLNHDIPSFHR